MKIEQKKIRILHLIPSLSGGGAERQLQLIVPLLETQGYENHIMYLKRDEHLEKLCLPEQQLHYFPVRSNYSPLIFLKIIRLIRMLRPDIVHSWIMQMDILVGMASFFYNISWVLREPSCIEAGYHHWKFRLRAKLGKRTRAIIANSSGGHDYWRNIYADKEVYVIPNYLPIKEIASHPQCDKAAIGLNESQKIILFAGRVDAGKNLEILFEALCPLLRRDPDLVFIICGDGIDRPMLEQKVIDAGLSHQTMFMGYIDREKLWGIMKAAEAFVFVSLFEGLPNAVLEAAACNAPLVLSDIPAHRDFFDENSAKFVRSNDVDEIRAGIAEILSGSCARQVSNAMNKIKKLDSEFIVRQYDKFYHGVIGRK